MKDCEDIILQRYADYYEFQDKVYKLIRLYSEDHKVRYINMINFSKLTGIPFNVRTTKFEDTEEARKLIDALSGPHGETLYKALVIKREKKTP